MAETYVSVVTNGKLDLNVSAEIRAKLIECEGKVIQVTLSEYSRKRSLDQNAYWFAVLDKHIVKPCRREGDNLSSFALHVRIMHALGYEQAVMWPDGTVSCERMESKKFTSVEWQEFMERARAWIAQEWNIYIPEPGEV